MVFAIDWTLNVSLCYSTATEAFSHLIIKNCTAHGMARSIKSYESMLYACRLCACSWQRSRRRLWHEKKNVRAFFLLSAEARLRTHVQLIHNKPQWINLFFSSLDSITWMVAVIECGIFGPGINTYYLHIWLNFFPPGSELFCDHSVSVAHKKPDCRITIPSELAWTYSRVSIRWHGGWRVPVECANQSNTEIYT